MALQWRPDQAVGLDPFLDPRQGLRQRATDGGLFLRRPPAALAGCGRLFGLRVGFCVGRVLFPVLLLHRGDGLFEILEAQLKLVGVELLRAGRVPGEAELPDQRLEFLQKLLHPGILGGHDRLLRRRSRRVGLQRGMLAFQMLAVRPLGGEGEGLRLEHRPNLGRQAVQERRVERKRHARSLSHDPKTATK